MSTSGSVDFQNSRTNIIESALRKCGVLREGVSATSDQLTAGALDLNTILKSLAASGMPLWAIKQAAIFPIHDINRVALGPSGGHAATTWVHTQVATTGVTSDTALIVDDITGISASDVIGVELDDGTMHWTTVNGAPSGSTVTLTSGLASAAAEDSHVYTYTSKTVRPLKVIQANLYDYNTDTESPLNIVSRDEYIRIGSKTEEGPPNQIYYDPQLTQGVLKFYPRFQNGSKVITIWFQRPFEDMDAAGDNLDFPQECESYIIWELAATIAPAYGVPARKYKMIQDKAIYERAIVDSFGMEEGSIYMTPNQRGR